MTSMSSTEPEQPKIVSANRVLACVLCKQRRVKCSRSFPCSNCTRAGVQCVQSTVQQRRRRFAERGLLDRLYYYEDLLQQNHITFEPLHSSASAAVGKATSRDDDHKAHLTWGKEEDGDREDKEASPHRAVRQSIKRVALDDEDDDDTEGNNSDYNYEHTDHQIKLTIQAHDHLLFGAPNPDVHLPSMHPGQVEIFQLWQIYLDNVNPLLKVTHTPTLQPRIIEAVSDMRNISDALEALLFSIYCTAILSMKNEECLASFRFSRDYLLERYQVACKEALLKCSPWRTTNVDALTALHLYLISVAPQVDPRSLGCMVAVSIHIAERMGMQSESSYNTPACKPLEAEMRRRLWWSLVLFDHRICEIVGQEKSTSLSPIWDCRSPLQVNDFEMQAAMKKPPAKHDTSATEALFVVVRSELANFVRNSASHLAILGYNPSVDKISQANGEDGGLKVFETMIENQYLVHCNPEVPLHFMTIWTTRSFFARRRLMEHYFTHAKSAPEQLTNAQRSKALGYALLMLECDTELRTSPLIKGYVWLVEAIYSPVLAHFHILNGLAKRPDEEHADKAWSAICDNYLALISGPKHHRTRIMFTLKYSRITLQTWEAREKLRIQQNIPSEPAPRLVVDARISAMQMSSNDSSIQNSNRGSPSFAHNPGLSLNALSDGSPMSLLNFPSLGHSGLQASIGGQGFGFPTPVEFFPNISSQASMEINMDQFWVDEGFKYT